MVRMTKAEFDIYLGKVNAMGGGFIPLMICCRCGKPIKDTAVVLTRFDPPLWLHRKCDEGWNGSRRPKV